MTSFRIMKFVLQMLYISLYSQYVHCTWVRKMKDKSYIYPIFAYLLPSSHFLLHFSQFLSFFFFAFPHHILHRNITNPIPYYIYYTHFMPALFFTVGKLFVSLFLSMQLKIISLDCVYVCWYIIYSMLYCILR